MADMKLPLMIKRFESRNLPSEQFNELSLRFIWRGSSSRVPQVLTLKRVWKICFTKMTNGSKRVRIELHDFRDYTKI